MDWFSKLFHQLRRKFSMYTPPHLRYIATLPCEIRKSTNVTKFSCWTWQIICLTKIWSDLYNLPQEHVNSLLQMLSKSVTFLDFRISQCSVATYCRWPWKSLWCIHKEFFYKSIDERILKMVHVCQNISKNLVAYFFETLYIITKLVTGVQLIISKVNYRFMNKWRQ